MIKYLSECLQLRLSSLETPKRERGHPAIKMPFDQIKKMRAAYEAGGITQKEAWEIYAKQYGMSYGGTHHILNYMSRVKR